MKKLILIIACIFFAGFFSDAQVNLPEPDTRISIAYNIQIPITKVDDWEIMHMETDGSAKKNITNNNDVAWTYHAYKDRLFFISDRDTCYRCFFLYEMNKNGENIRRVSDLRLEDSWMDTRKNGEEMVVAGRIGKNIRYQIFMIQTASGEYRQITSDTAGMFIDPVFSPDGSTVALSYRKNKRDKSSHEELFLMDLENGELNQLTRYPEDNISAKTYGYKAGAARWHPTENFISYVSRQDGKNSIFAVTPDGTKQWKLIENSGSEGWHDWSEDGNWLVFNSSDIEETQYHITLMNWKTKERFQLTDNNYKSQLGPVFVEK